MIEKTKPSRQAQIKTIPNTQLRTTENEQYTHRKGHKKTRKKHFMRGTDKQKRPRKEFTVSNIKIKQIHSNKIKEKKNSISDPTNYNNQQNSKK